MWAEYILMFRGKVYMNSWWSPLSAIMYADASRKRLYNISYMRGLVYIEPYEIVRVMSLDVLLVR